MGYRIFMALITALTGVVKNGSFGCKFRHFSGVRYSSVFEWVGPTNDMRLS